MTVVPTSDPVPELEHVLLVDPEVLDLWTVGAQRDKVQGHVCRVLGPIYQSSFFVLWVH